MKRAQFSILICNYAMLILLSGCAVQGLPFGKQLPVESGAILFEDDFSDERSRWDTWEDEFSTVDIQAGGLVFNIRESGNDYLSLAGKKFSDVDARVSAAKLSGTNNNDFGMVCRYQDANNFYGFLISSDGYAGIIKVREGVRTMISGEMMQFSELVHQGEAGNQLRIICLGQSLALFVNDTIVLLAEDSEFSQGEVGLIVGAIDDPGVEIFFDDFKVLQP